MRLRVFIIETSEVMRESLVMHVESLGHEAIMASSFDNCPHYHSDNERCSQKNACGDALIIGQDFPVLKGIDFIARRLRGGCKGAAANNAIICRPWSENERGQAKTLGCHFFETPMSLSEVSDWLNEVGKNTPANRKLTSLPEVS